MISAYQDQVSRGQLTPDAAQAAVAAHLHGLSVALAGYAAGAKRGFFSRKPKAAPRGLYLWGDVGRGKTMLMDMFFDAAPVARKRRVHFHEFMLDVHARIHARRQLVAAADVIGPVAQGLAGEFSLLCLDEFQVHDITDAMILGRLFEALLNAGVVIVVTSNTPPQALYQDGLNRQLFVPFIGLIEAKFDVLCLNASADYRLGRVQARAVYLTPLGRAARAQMQALWADLTDGAEGVRLVLQLKGRELAVPRAAHGVAWFSFADLCEKAVGTADFRAVAERFSCVFVEGVPVLGPAKRNEARRFTLLVDTLYDRGIRLVLAAEKPAEQLKLAPRTLSRLQEMGSAGWWGGVGVKKIAETSRSRQL